MADCQRCNLLTENAALRREVAELRREIEKLQKQVEKLLRIIRKLKEIIRGVRLYVAQVYHEAMRTAGQRSGVPRGTYSLEKGRAVVAQEVYHRLPEVD